MNTLKVSGPERDTILAALRYWQRNVASKSYASHTLPEWDIACNGRDAPINDGAIDDLCERLNQ